MVRSESLDGLEKTRDVETNILPATDASRDASPAGVHRDAVFGELNDKGPNYRNVGWISTAILMTKTNVGLGVLGIPFVFQVVGIVPGVLLIVFYNFIVMWTAWMVGQVKLRHPEVYSFADMGLLLGGARFGPMLREVFNVIFILEMVFVCGSGMVGISVALNAISTHGTCTAVFIAVAGILGALLACIRTLGKLKILGWVGMVSIVIAILTLTISVIVQDRPADAPKEGPWEKNVQVFAHPTFAQGMSAMASVIFSNGAIPVYFGLVAEMREPRQFTKAMVCCHVFFNALYILIGVIGYWFCGQYVAYPALGSAGVLMKKVCYGLAIPGIVMTLCLYCHIPAKTIFVRVLRDSPHLTSNSPRHWITWVSSVFGVIIVGYIIASAIPIFGSLISLIGALFVPVTAIIPYAHMWLHDNWFGSSDRPLKTKLVAAWACLIIVVGWFFVVAGSYGAVSDIITAYNTGGTSPAWSCVDNSNSV